MTNHLSKCVLILVIFILANGCSKDDITPDPSGESHTKLVYTSTLCSINEVYWMPDNRHILMNDFCNGTVKLIDADAGTHTLITLPIETQYQRFFVSKEIPDHFFFLELNDGNLLFDLYSYNIQTAKKTLLAPGLPGNPILTNYMVGGKRLATSGNPIRIIDLESGNVDLIQAHGSIRSFSADGRKLLYYKYNNQNVLVSAHEYDYICECETSVSTTGYPERVAWTPSQYYGGDITYGEFLNGWIDSVTIQPFDEHIILESRRHYVEGPVSFQQGERVIYFSYDPSGFDADSVSVLELDFQTHQFNRILRVPGVPYLSLKRGHTTFSISPDHKRLVTAFTGSHVYVSELPE